MAETVILSALGIVGSVVAALVWLLKKLFSQSDETLKSVTESQAHLAVSITSLAAASENQALATANNAKAGQEWQEYVKERFDRLDKVGDNILSQTVREQTVEHQTVVTKN